MTAEKRTVRSEIREFCEEIRAGFQTWRGHRQIRADVARDLPSEETTAQEEAILFTPLPLDADVSGMIGSQAAAAPPTAGGKPGGAVTAAGVCPVTRQRLDPASKIYQCRQCGIYYSAEGWEFLLQNAKGQCCGCRSVKTVLPVVRVR